MDDVNVKDRKVGKKIWPLLLVISMYAIFFIPLLLFMSQVYISDSSDIDSAGVDLPFVLIVLCIVFYIVVAVGSLVHVIRSVMRGETEFLGRQAAVLKMVNIPWFVINFLASLLIFMVLGVASRGLIIFFIPVGVSITWIIMMGTSIYSLGYLILLKKEKRLGTSGFLLHLWLQLMFLTDVVGILVLRRQLRRSADD